MRFCSRKCSGTPWTLSNDKVWDSTHRLGAKLFKLSALIVLLAAFFPDYAAWLIVAPVLLATVIVTVYSYLEYRKLK